MQKYIKSDSYEFFAMRGRGKREVAFEVVGDRRMAEVRIDGRAHISKIPNTHQRTNKDKRK